MQAYTVQGPAHAPQMFQIRAHVQGVDESGRLMQRLTKGIAAAVKRAQGRIGQMQKQLEASRGSEATSKQADLIMASLYKCAPPQAAKAVVCP